MKKREVLITGSSGGIGLATVRRFLDAGYGVRGIDLAAPQYEHPGFRWTIADVRDPEAMVEALDELRVRGRRLAHLVSLAGRVVPGELEVLEREPPAAIDAFMDSIQLNLIAQFTLIRAGLPELERADGDRSITLCSSINAFAGFGAPAYSAAKAGLTGLMHALAGRLGGKGIRINTVVPGTIRTPPTEAEAAAADDPRRFDRVAQQAHLGRVGTADDVAAVIESLADRLTHVTDEVLRVDGGQLHAR